MARTTTTRTDAYVLAGEAAWWNGRLPKVLHLTDERRSRAIAIYEDWTERTFPSFDAFLAEAKLRPGQGLYQAAPHLDRFSFPQ